MCTINVKIILLLIVLGNDFVTSAPNYESLPYTVPEPLIQVFRPRGLRVSIPHYQGIQLFAFHGNINNPMYGLDAGQLSKDILKRQGEEWVFKDAHIKLDVGDKIYYWLFVIKENLGYRYDDGLFEVKSITPGSVNQDVYIKPNPPLHSSQNSFSTSEEITKQQNRTNEEISPNKNTDVILGICERTVLNLTQTLLGLQYQIESLRDTNMILRDLTEKHSDSSKSLIFDGRIPTNDDPLFTAKEIIKQKLDLSVNVVKAVRNIDKSITFEVSSLNEKLNIIKTAREELKNSKIILTY